MNSSIFYNGNIYIDEENFVEAVMIEDGIITMLGTSEEVLSHKKDSTNVVDVLGKTVLPGFVDSHIHLYGVGDNLVNLNLYSATSIDEIIELSKKFIKENNVESGILLAGRGWNQDYFTTGEARILLREDLDAISIDHPIILTRVCGHIATVNSKALECLEIGNNPTQIEGGTIDIDENGDPTGVFRENALEILGKIIPNPTLEDRVKIITTAMKYANENGITSIQTNDIRENILDEMNDAYEYVHNSGLATLRTYHQCTFNYIESLQKAIDNGFFANEGDDCNRVGLLKLFVDGSLGARTALMRQDYNDEAGTNGIECFTQEQLDAIIKLADDNNIQVAVHAIGDKAIEMVLDSYEKVIVNGQNTNRHGIVHCQITDYALLERFKAMDVFAYVQPIFLHYDMHIAEDRVGHELASTSYAFKTMENLGLHIGYGTDSPVEDLDTMNNIHCAVNRQDLKLSPEDGWFPDEKVSLNNAIYNYTHGSAYASFDEGKKGKIAVGYFGDLVILESNIFEVLPEEIKNIEVNMTVVGGKVVYINN